jgi:hypothetical protein
MSDHLNELIAVTAITAFIIIDKEIILHETCNTVLDNIIHFCSSLSKSINTIVYKVQS